ELPTVDGMFTATESVKLAPVTVSVIVHDNVVPLYVICTFMMSPLCRFTPELVMSTAGTVGEAPSVYIPVESDPSPSLLYKSNFTATLRGIPSGSPGAAAP